MSFEFTENVRLELPNIKDKFTPFTESHDYRQNHKLITEIAAIHAGLTSNYNMYTKEALNASMASWVSPYAKPIIMNHDEFSEPVGRVMAARMETEADGTPYVRLQVAILDPVAVEKVMDDRYLTGSVGGSAESAKCSVCNVDWAKESLEKGLPCRHQRGKVYEGKLAYFELGDLSFREYSFVNVPADKNSGVRNKQQQAANAQDNDSEWTYTVKMFSMDMNNPSIVEMNDANTGHNILESMKKRDAHATYMNVKGTFLSVSALDYKENNDETGEIVISQNTIYNELDPEKDKTTSLQNSDKSLEEKNMSKATANDATDITEADEDDILAVSEQLSADLAASVEENAEEADEGSEPSAAEADEETEESSESSDTETDPAASTEEDETHSEDEEEGTEKQLDATSEEGEVERAEDAEETASEPEEKVEGQEDGDAESNLPPSREADEQDDSVVTELEAAVEKLKTENGRLRSALHNMLVERVVDAKIARGVAEAAERADLVTEHATRTAASLADSLKDLERLPAVSRRDEPTTEKVTDKSVTNTVEDGVVTDNPVVEAEEPEADWKDVAEMALTGRLMNRVKF